MVGPLRGDGVHRGRGHLPAPQVPPGRHGQDDRPFAGGPSGASRGNRRRRQGRGRGLARHQGEVLLRRGERGVHRRLPPRLVPRHRRLGQAQAANRKDNEERPRPRGQCRGAARVGEDGMGRRQQRWFLEHVAGLRPLRPRLARDPPARLPRPEGPALCDSRAMQNAECRMQNGRCRMCQSVL